MEQFWILLIIIHIILGSFREALKKYSINKISILVFMSYYYFAAFLSMFSVSIFLYHQNPLSVSSQYWFLYPMALIKTIGVVSLNKAVKTSLSKTSAAAGLSTLIALFLTMLFLKEYQLFNPTDLQGLKKIFGLILFLIFLFFSIKPKLKESKQWAGYRLLSAFLLGLHIFLVKLMTIKSLAPRIIITNEYLVSFLITLTMGIYKKRSFKIGKKIKTFAFSGGAVTSFALLAYYMALALAPATKVISFRRVLTTPAYTLIGYLFFKERKILTKSEKIGLVFGLGSILLLAF